MKEITTMMTLIKNTILEYVDVDPDSITAETKLVDDLNLNSYELISIVGSLEQELGTSIPDEELRNMQTVGDVVDYLKNHAQN